MTEPSVGVWRFKSRQTRRFLEEQGLLDPAYVLVKVARGEDWTELDELVKTFQAGVKLRMSDTDMLTLPKDQMAPLIEAFEARGVADRLVFRLLPTKDVFGGGGRGLDNRSRL